MLSFLFTALLFPPFVISVTAGSGNNSAWAPGDFLYSPCPAYINEQLAGGNTKKMTFRCYIRLNFVIVFGYRCHDGMG